MKTGGLYYQFISKVLRKAMAHNITFIHIFVYLYYNFTVIGPDLLGILQHATGRGKLGQSYWVAPLPFFLFQFFIKTPFCSFLRGGRGKRFTRKLPMNIKKGSNFLVETFQFVICDPVRDESPSNTFFSHSTISSRHVSANTTGPSGPGAGRLWNRICPRCIACTPIPEAF